MRVFKNMSPIVPEAPARDNKRKKGRIRAEMLQTNIGTAVDLSESGIRVEKSGSIELEPGATIMLTLRAPTREVSSPAKVRWKRKVGWFKSQAGLEFLDTSEAFKRVLRELSAACMDLRIIQNEGDATDEAGAA